MPMRTVVRGTGEGDGDGDGDGRGAGGSGADGEAGAPAAGPLAALPAVGFGDWVGGDVLGSTPHPLSTTIDRTSHRKGFSTGRSRISCAAPDARGYASRGAM